MSANKPFANLVVTGATLLFAACLLLPSAAATAGNPKLAQQEAAQAREARPGLEDAVERNPVEWAIDNLFEVFKELFRRPPDPGHDPDGGEQGASIDPSGHRLTQN